MRNKDRRCVVGKCVSETSYSKAVDIILTPFTSDLEISKPQRNTKKAEPANPVPRRRSRSPDYTRGGTGPPPRDGRFGGNQNSMSPRDRDRRFRDRDDYRPMRSPSPRGAPRGVRSRDRSRDRFDGRYRSRSRSPPRRHRSSSPRRDYTEDGLDLRRRLPHEVPDIQILVLNEGLPRYVSIPILDHHCTNAVVATSYAMWKTRSAHKIYEAMSSSSAVASPSRQWSGGRSLKESWL